MKTTREKWDNNLKIVKNVLFHPSVLLGYIFRKPYDWKESGAGGFKTKVYKSYDEYLSHQKSKLKLIRGSWLPDYDVKYREALRDRLRSQKVVKAGMNVLCLAARIGTEVKSFLDLGCFAVGLDLNPGKDNKYVVAGDFHNIQFPSSTVDAIFTNSLDHSFDFEKLIGEIKRVLKPQGFLVLEIAKGKEEGYDPGYYEAVAWEKTENLLKIFYDKGFEKIGECDFEYPDPGTHVSLVLKK